MKAPNKAMSALDEKVITTLVTVITNEEQACGLQQPTGIGQRPRPLIVDYYPANVRRDDYPEVSLYYMSTIVVVYIYHFCVHNVG